MSFIKSPFKVVPKKPQTNIVDISLFIQRMEELNKAIQDVNDLKQQIAEEHRQNQEQMRAEHEQKLAQLEQVVVDTLNSIEIPVPENGKDAEPVDYEKVVSEAVKRIPKPKDGKTPQIDTLEIAKAAAKFVEIPKVEIPKIEIPTPQEIDHEEVANQVLSIIEKGKKKLSLKHISDFTDGLEQTLRPIRSLMAGFRGGGDVVKAGSNITITTDSDGKKVITSTGGSGFTALSATEVPNGIRTTFTFAAATAQPTYLVVDNVWMKATTAAGTVNWTWNNGTKQATLTVPASDDIWGVV